MKRLVEWWRNRYGVTITIGQTIRIKHGLFSIMSGKVEQIEVTRDVHDPDVAHIRVIQHLRKWGQ